MQIQKISNNQSFTGYKLQTIKTPAKKIDIYKLTEQDDSFIKRTLDILKGQHFPKDRLSVGEGTNREIFENSLKASPNKWGNTVLVAIEDNKKIAGIINVERDADDKVQGLVCLNGSQQPSLLSRESLILAALKETAKEQYKAVTVNADNFTESIRKFFNKFGFKTEKTPTYKQMVIECEDIPQAINKYETNSPHIIENYEDSKNVKMEDILNLD